MSNKILIERPEKTGCLSCHAYSEDCPACKKLYSERLAAAKKKASDIAYVIVYDNWNNYLAAVRKPFKADATNSEKNIIETDFVKEAKGNLTRDLYPFSVNSSKFCTSIWNAAIKDLSHRLFGPCPIVKIRTGYKNKKGKDKFKRITLWY